MRLLMMPLLMLPPLPPPMPPRCRRHDVARCRGAISATSLLYFDIDADDIRLRDTPTIILDIIYVAR